MDNQLKNASIRKKTNEPQLLLDYLNYMKDIKGISPKSSDTYRYNLMIFLRFLSHRRSTLPMQEMTLHRLKSIDITHMDAQSLGQVDLNDLHAFLLFAEGPFHERDYAIITLLLNCGMRRSELTDIDLCDIRDNALTVLGKGNKERTIYLNQACQQALEVHLKVRLLEKTPERNALDEKMLREAADRHPLAHLRPDGRRRDNRKKH